MFGISKLLDQVMDHLNDHMSTETTIDDNCTTLTTAVFMGDRCVSETELDLQPLVDAISQRILDEIGR